MPKTQTAEIEDQQHAGPLDARLSEAEAIVKRSMFYSMGAGLVPVPILDLAGIAGFQINMLQQLSKLYEVPFMEHKAKNILAALVGSVGTASVGVGLVGSVIKIIPFVGSLTGVITLPIVSGASTYAVGKVFIQHFEAGGTFLDFNPSKTRAYFEEQFKEGRAAAASAKDSPKS